MADDEQLSKRERQKRRRQEKQEAEHRAQQAARRRRRLALGLVVLLLAGGAGTLAWGWTADRAAERELVAEAEERFDELGCTPVEERGIEPSPHIAPADWPDNPPEAIYTHRPTTSGPHFDPVVQSGVYDKVLDERPLVHNLEHGYVNVFYDPDADPEQIAALTAFAEEQLDGDHEKIIVSQWKADFPDDARFAWTAWGARQLCRDFHEGALLAFLQDWHWHAGDAPEAGLPPHHGPGDGGGIDPEAVDGDLLFPPLGDAHEALPGAEPHGVEPEDDAAP